RGPNGATLVRNVEDLAIAIGGGLLGDFAQEGGGALPVDSAVEDFAEAQCFKGGSVEIELTMNGKRGRIHVSLEAKAGGLNEVAIFRVFTDGRQLIDGASAAQGIQI